MRELLETLAGERLISPDVVLLPEVVEILLEHNKNNVIWQYSIVYTQAIGNRLLHR
jgi:hypothetical protein